MNKLLLSSVIATLMLSGCATPDLAAKKPAVVKPVSTKIKAKDGSSLYPPNAKPGECYARVLTPPKYATTTEKVLARAADAQIDVIPATYKTVTEKVLIKEASTVLKVIPATYKTVTEKVLVEPAKNVITRTKAKFKTVTEKVLIKPAYTTWKKGVNPVTGLSSGKYSAVKGNNGNLVSKYDQSTGEIMCLVEVPAEYKTITKQVINTPAKAMKKTLPAKYKKITKRVVVKAASTRSVKVPAQYKTVQVRKVVTPTKTKTTKIPAKYKTVQKRTIATQPKLEWREILCETNTTPGLISRLQKTLNSKGYKAGKPDGKFGRQTLNAVIKFQKANGLPSGQLTLGTLKKLGVQ